jgi:gamma-glutamylcyclotransferase (GGCT)/AIG2-like uncharacterized protein YtfP
MFNQNAFVKIKQGLERFHYAETQTYSLAPVINKLKKEQVLGKVLRIDKEHDAVAVQFPKMKECIWFKTYEIDHAGWNQRA